MTKTGLEFRNWRPARRVGSPSEARTILVIVICLTFVIWNLEFLTELCPHQNVKDSFDDCGDHPIFES
jgi:hypothetical protein